jgi:hypothetical protein
LFVSFIAPTPLSTEYIDKPSDQLVLTSLDCQAESNSAANHQRQRSEHTPV